jgi:hypothetical protein
LNGLGNALQVQGMTGNFAVDGDDAGSLLVYDAVHNAFVAAPLNLPTAAPSLCQLAT